MNGALRHGHSPGGLSYTEFFEASELIKVNVATGRDNIPGSVLRLLPEKVRRRLYCAEVERLAGREEEHVKGWAECDVCLVPKKRDVSYLGSSCLRCACGGCWTRSSGHSLATCLASVQNDSVLTSFHFWWRPAKG